MPQEKKVYSIEEGRKLIANMKKRPDKPKKKRKVATQVIAICMELQKRGIVYTTEYQFNPERKWRFDIRILPVNGVNLAIEYHGGQYTAGGHLRGGNFKNDLDKFNSAQMLGWKVLAFTTDHFGKDGTGAYGVVQMVRQTLGLCPTFP